MKPTAIIQGPKTKIVYGGPAGLAIDRGGTIYVANQFSMNVYSPGATGDVAPLTSFAGEKMMGMGQFSGVAILPETR